MGNLAPPFFIHDQEAGVRCRQAKEMMAEASPGSSAGEVGSDVGDQGGEGFREIGHAGEGKGLDTRREERIRRAVWPSDCHPPRAPVFATSYTGRRLSCVLAGWGGVLCLRGLSD